MKRGPKIVWTAPPEKIGRDRQKKLEARNLPQFYPERDMNDQAKKTWDVIDIGSPVRLLVDLNSFKNEKFPYLLLTPVPSLTPQFPAGTFAIYIGMTPVKMRGGRGHTIVTRNYRTLLIGGGKFLLDHPDYIAVV
jgi:hypothetical protein